MHLFRLIDTNLKEWDLYEFLVCDILYIYIVWYIIIYTNNCIPMRLYPKNVGI
jgi:hypothetical protein